MKEFKQAKIVILCPSVYPLLTKSESIKSAGGAEAQLLTLGLSFAKRGYDVHFIVDDFGQPTVERIDNATVHKVPLRYMGGPNYHLPLAWSSLWKTLVKIKGDIHLIKLPRDLLLPLGLFCKLYNKSTIFIGQIDTDVDPIFLRNNYNFVAYLFFRVGLRLVDYIVAQNQVQKDGFLNAYGKNAKMIRSVLTLPKTTNSKKEDYILWVGSSAPKKQPQKFLELARRLPEYQFKMIMSLDNQNRNCNSLEKELGSLPNLVYLGFVPFEKIAEYYKGAILFVSTSLYEGFPNTFLQAWQCSTPVISLNVDPDGVIEKYELGRLSRTFDKLCSDVTELVNNVRLRNRMAQNAITYLYNTHTPEIIIPKYEEIFRFCLRVRQRSWAVGPWPR